MFMRTLAVQGQMIMYLLYTIQRTPGNVHGEYMRSQSAPDHYCGTSWNQVNDVIHSYPQ